MLEICFDEALSGKLIYFNAKKRRNGFSFNDVFAIHLHLESGDLSEGVFSESRFKYLMELSTDEWLGNEPLYTQRDWKKEKDFIEEIVERARNGERILFWLNLEAGAICSFMYIVSQIGEGANISTIVYSNNMIPYEPADLSDFYEKQDRLIKKDFEMIVKRWDEITKEKSLLRVVINGSVLGVNEDFYDAFIYDQIPDGEFTALYLLSDIHHKAHIHLTTDFILLKRVCKILRSEKIVVVGWKDIIQSPLDLYEQWYCKNYKKWE